MFDRFKGVQQDVVGEGTHFRWDQWLRPPVRSCFGNSQLGRIPWVQTPHIYDIRTRPRIVPTETGTKGAVLIVCTVASIAHCQGKRAADLQQVKLTLRMLARPRVEALPTIHSNLGQDYMERVVPSISNEVLKAVVVRST